MERIIIQEMVGNAPLMAIIGFIAWRLDKRVSVIETRWDDVLELLKGGNGS